MELVVVVGGANVDVKARTANALVTGTSNPGTVVRTPGGVGRNVAENLARLGSRVVALVSTVGSDPDGDWLLEETAAAGVDVSPVLRGGRTGRYVAVLDAGGELVVGVSDMAATDALGPDVLDHDLLRSADLVVVDGNLPATTVDAVLALGVRVVIDPVSVAKARRISPLLSGNRPVYAITPNEDELAALGSVDGAARPRRRGGVGTPRRGRLAAQHRRRRGGARGAGSDSGGRDRSRRRDARGVLPPVDGGRVAGRRRGVRPRGGRAHRGQPAHGRPRPARQDVPVTVLPRIGLTDEVAEAVAAGRPVVALESTIISHGMPYPQNVAMATEVEGIVREHGAVPATIAVLGGVPKIGLSPDDLELLASDPSVVKASVRDLPSIIARRGHGATTVAATMRLASLAGIRVFVTGGLGGVHRGAATSFDVSADLTELSTTPVCVVSAGVKSILDIGLTLEKLETLGVPVLVDGSDEFPSFYSRSSGFAAPLRADGPDEIARAMDAAWSLGLTSGLVVAHPIPVADEIPASEMDPVIAQALADLDAQGIGGRDATPYLLGRIVELTDGRSLTANIALVRENARVGAEIAVRYAAHRGREGRRAPRRPPARA